MVDRSNAESPKYRVMKFGGTSVGSPERLLRVIDIVVRTYQKYPVAVVVSAMQHTTDQLLEAAKTAARGDLAEAEKLVDQIMDLATSNGLFVLQHMEQSHGTLVNRPAITPLVREMLAQLRQLLNAISLLKEQTPQTLDLVLSFGERLSALVLSELLTARGVPAIYVDSRTWTVTDDHFGSALVDNDATRQQLAKQIPTWQGKVPVSTGFLGQTPDGRTTTLGRNGSDYTASMLARWLEAEEVIIWTDVSGVMTADPALVADAYPLSRLSYWEALELVDFGAKMFHPRTMIPLIEEKIPLRIQNTMRPDAPGTLINEVGSTDKNFATSVTSVEDLALLGVQARRLAIRAQLGGRVLNALENAGVTVWMSSLSAHGQAIAIAIRQSEVERAQKAIHEELAFELQRGEVEPASVHQPVTLLTLVAEAMGKTVNVAGRFFHSLGAVGIPIRAVAQGASSRSISCVIDASDTPVAVRTVHSTFNFAHQEVSLLLLGKGTVGGNLLAQIKDEQARLERDYNVLLRVVGIGDSRAFVFDSRGLPLDLWEAKLAEARSSEKREKSFASMLEELRQLPVPILVDCTGSDRMEEVYQLAFEKGVHVVAANKKPLTIPWLERKALIEAAAQKHRFYVYSTTVGASLPVIETLKNLVRTGDRVSLIEGSFSGTIGFIANELMKGISLSEATRRARDLGYTEPNPQDDLSGTDVARKALILARELGLALNFNDILIEPFIPAHLLEPMSADLFFEKLKGYDEEMRARIDALKKENQALRYLARVDSSAEVPTITVAPVGIGLEHPASRLRGTEAFVAFTTDRYKDYPLIVQGAGAGGVVTAAGVLSDILKISMTLRGR